MTDAPHTTAVLIDGHALAYRSYFALPPLTAPNGETTHAILGFMRQTLRLMKQRGNQVIVVFDPPVKTFRHEQYEDYKAGRAATPDDLKVQINRLRELIDALGLPRLEVEGFEADDVIATLTKRAKAAGMNAVIVSSDRDSYQLLDEHVKVLTSDFKLLGAADVQEKYGVSVAQWVDYRALTGDSSDNIPGAKGIGPKTAAKLLQDYGTLDNILAQAQAGTLEPKSAEKKIVASLDDIHKSRELSQMVTDLPLDIEMGALRGHGDPARLQELLSELGLSSIQRELQALDKAPAAPATPAAEPAPTFSFSAPPPADWQAPQGGEMWGYTLSREDDLQAQLLDAATFDGNVTRRAPSELPAAEASLFDVPAAPEDPKPKRKKKAAEPQATVNEQVFVGVQAVNAAAAKALATHLQVRGLDVQPADDPLLLAYLLDPSNTAMPAVTQRYLGQSWPDDAATRAALSAALQGHLWEQLDEDQQRLYSDLEKPLSRVLARMEVRGVRLDSAYLRGLSLSMKARLDTLEAQIHEAAGREFAISSRDQLETVLYDELLLASGKKTKLTGKRSTAVGALEPLINEHPIVPLLLEYRELSKLRGTYLDPLPNLVNPATGRLHTTFAQTAVATGRLSSLNPNLQNIPIRSEAGRDIRKGFIADEGYLLVAADYSQIELRLLAQIADDDLMKLAFQSGADIHRRTAAQVLGLDEASITPEQRRAAKTVNFGVLYGMSAHRLSNDLGIPFAEASGFIERYFATYPKIREYIDQTLAFGRKHGYVKTLYGRRRYTPELLSSNRNIREAGERLAYNMPIQGTAADIMKMAMLDVEAALSPLGARLLLQVHDELLVEAPKEKAQEVAALLKTTMMNAAGNTVSVPLEVEVGIGENWLETK